MSDVFISYARSTAKQARAVADALRARGYSVWRDEDLPSHRTYADVIQEQLGSARAVVVIWSAEAVTSQWVRSEADRARGENKLVQLAVDRSPLPMPFDQIQCSDLALWSGEDEHPAWQKVVASVAELTGAAAPVAAPRMAEPAPAPAAPAQAPAPASAGQDFHAFLFTDIEGASLLWLNHRAAMQEALGVYEASLRAAVAARGGEVFKSDGEAFYAAFPGPANAVLAAGEIQRALAGRPFPGIGTLKARMALHFGTAERRGGEYFGPALNRCAKLLALGHGGQVLASATVADLLAGEHEIKAPLRSLGAHPLDDPLQSIGVHQVLIEGLAQDFPPLRLPEVHPNNLPRRQGTLIGREAEMAQLSELLAKGDLVTITGTGGVGKTRIAIEFGHTQLGVHDDGVWLVELAPLSDPEQVPGAVARAMSIELPAGQDPVAALVDRLRPRRCLIVLDNCEHVIDAVAAVAEALLATAGAVKLLASSQELLGVEGERVYRLRSLGEPDAVALFIERASAADAGFTVRPRDKATIAAICQRLDGIPLAIEMAAARAPALGCEGVFQRLDDRFRVLTGGRRTALPRQRTLQATLDWSFGLLSPTDAAVFGRLGVFTGGFTLEAASEVAADASIETYEVVDALASLVAKSLVAADAEADRTRYRLLETTRAYALEKLAAAGETEATQRRHAEYFARFVTPARLDYYSLSDDAFVARYAADMENIERAMDWAFGQTGDAELGITLTAMSWVIWVFRSLVPEYVRWSEIAAARLSDATPPAMRLQQLRAQASAYMNSGFAPLKAIEMVDAMKAELIATGDPLQLGDPLSTQVAAFNVTGQPARARAVSDELNALVARLPPSRLSAIALFHTGFVTWAQEGEAAARSQFDGAVAAAQAIGAEGMANFILAYGATSLTPYDDPDTAIAGLRKVLAGIRSAHMMSGPAMSMTASRLVGLLAVRAAPGDLEEAIAIARTHEKVGGRTMAFLYVLNLALIALKSGRPRDGARLAGFADAQRAAIGADGDLPTMEFRKAWDLLRAELSEADLTTLRAEGARLSQDEAFRLAMGAE